MGAGIGKFTPAVWKRVLASINWYNNNKAKLNKLNMKSKAMRRQRMQPDIVIASMDDPGWENETPGATVMHHTECEWLNDGHAGVCGSDAADVCKGACLNYDPSRNIPSSTCFYPWFAVKWIRRDVSNHTQYAGWDTNPSDGFVEWFETRPEFLSYYVAPGGSPGDPPYNGGDKISVNDPNNPNWYGVSDQVLCGGLRATSWPAVPSSPESENISDQDVHNRAFWTSAAEPSYVGSKLQTNYRTPYPTLPELERFGVGGIFYGAGMRPAINLAVIGAVQNSERATPLSEPGWDHWYSFREASACRHKAAPFNGVLPPAMNVNRRVQADGTEVADTWTHQHQVQSQPLGKGPIVPLHFFKSKTRSQIFGESGPAQDMREVNTTYPMFCMTPIYGGNGCCCVIEQ